MAELTRATAQIQPTGGCDRLWCGAPCDLFPYPVLPDPSLFSSPISFDRRPQGGLSFQRHYMTTYERSSPAIYYKTRSSLFPRVSRCNLPRMLPLALHLARRSGTSAHAAHDSCSGQPCSWTWSSGLYGMMFSDGRQRAINNGLMTRDHSSSAC